MHQDSTKSLENTNTAFTFVDLSNIQGRRKTGSVIFQMTPYLFAWYLKLISAQGALAEFDDSEVWCCCCPWRALSFFKHQAQFTRSDRLNLIFFSYQFSLRFRLRFSLWPPEFPFSWPVSQYYNYFNIKGFSCCCFLFCFFGLLSSWFCFVFFSFPCRTG